MKTLLYLFKISNMKPKILTLILVLTITRSYSQEKLELSIGVGNNGQLDKTLNDFYYLQHETAFLDESHMANSRSIKFNLKLNYHISDKYFMGINCGFYNRKDAYSYDWVVENLDFNYNQKIFNISPEFGVKIKLDDFIFSTGFETPVFIIGDFNYESIYEQRPDSVNVSNKIKSTGGMTGGIVFGINSFLGFKYFFSERFSIFSRISYGLLYADIGNKDYFTQETVIPSSTFYSFEYDKSYQKKYFSNPEFMFGFSFNLLTK